MKPNCMILRCEDPSFHWAASIKSVYSTRSWRHVTRAAEFRQAAFYHPLAHSSQSFYFIVGRSGVHRQSAQ
ncbi:hypothetical protein EXD76_04415 [BEV proteobacterium]|nr:hypothetical protein [Candidatus Symbiopectobacterium sp. Chty_BC]